MHWNFKTNWMCWGLHGNWTFSCLTSLEFKSQIPTYIELSYILQSIVNQILNVIFWFCIDKQTTHNERHTSPYFDSINSDFLFVCFLSLVRSNFEILWFGKIKFKTEKFPIFIRFVSALFSRFHSKFYWSLAERNFIFICCKGPFYWTFKCSTCLWIGLFVCIKLKLQLAWQQQHAKRPSKKGLRDDKQNYPESYWNDWTESLLYFHKL